MLPVNGNAPRRAESSLSQSMREIRDDAACPEHLGRNRYSADGNPR
jgi:hypothetical protein